MKALITSWFIFLAIPTATFSQSETKDIFPGADESTPSRSQYFSWFNHTNEGPTEEQTLANLEFFRWLHDEYGMNLDIYAFDAGAVDGKRFYGSTRSDRFKSQFPKGFSPIYEKANEMSTRLGLWGGPDGSGNTDQETTDRINMMVELCRDYDFELFKFDGVCGPLRPEKQDAFVEMMTECRKYSPDLILLNHRLNLGEEGVKHATTFLLGGAETYIDVHMSNEVTAPHHRAGAISRGLTPDLTRLTEDHGVCLSSALDYWEDDLILQAFNRNLILAPQIYGNPWLLRDDEFPTLARIFNLHEQYRDILVSGIVLPENQYGPSAVSRGDKNTRLLTLRNLSWNPKAYTVRLDKSIGLTDNGERVDIIQYHPTEKFLNQVRYGEEVEIEVLPFRSVLFKVSNEKNSRELMVQGIDYQVIPSSSDSVQSIRLLGHPGSSKRLKLTGPLDDFDKALIDREEYIELIKGGEFEIVFSGEKYQKDYHRKLADLEPIEVPRDIFSLYEATQFAADNNSLEARSLARSGSTDIPQVQIARNAFFDQSIFKARETWDKYLFDQDAATSFSVSTRWESYNPLGAALRIDLGKPTALDSLVIKIQDEFALQPYKSEEGDYLKVSKDLAEWQSIPFIASTHISIDMTNAGDIRYLSFPYTIMRVQDVIGYYQGAAVDMEDWKASNLQRPYVFDWHWNQKEHYYAQKVWKGSFTLSEIPKGSYLCVAINGVHGEEGALASFKVNGQYIGAPDRSPSYKSNTWEYRVVSTDRNYTYYLPLDEGFINQEIEVYAIAMNKELTDLRPEVWITSYPIPFEEKLLVLE